jgi:hypothetical protein
MVKYQAVIRLKNGEEKRGISRKCKADAIQDLKELKQDYIYTNARIEKLEFYPILK